MQTKLTDRLRVFCEAKEKVNSAIISYLQGQNIKGGVVISLEGAAAALFFPPPTV